MKIEEMKRKSVIIKIEFCDNLPSMENQIYQILTNQPIRNCSSCNNVLYFSFIYCMVDKQFPYRL